MTTNTIPIGTLFKFKGDDFDEIVEVKKNLPSGDVEVMVLKSTCEDVGELRTIKAYWLLGTWKKATELDLLLYS